MITHLFLVIACLAIFFVIYPADAIPWTSEENKALDADAIAVGQIVSYRDDGAHRYYEISVIKWIKNPQLDQTITMRSITPQVFDPHVPYAIFEKKDLGLFYVKLIDGEWRSTYYSKQIFASEQSQTIYNMKKLVGNNNPDSSVSLERVCKEGHVNAVKDRTGEIYCVKPQTLQKLRERGWAEPLGDIVSQRPSQTTSDWNAMKLVRNNDNIYCNSANEELSDQCYSLEEIIFGNARKNWKVLPGAGIILPENSTLTPIYKTSTLGLSQIDLNAMLDDKIFVNKCESNGGVWNYTYHDCEGLMQVCDDMGGVYLNDDVTPYCDPTNGCDASALVRVSCVFEYED